MDFKILNRILIVIFASVMFQLQAQNDIPYDNVMSAATYYNPAFAAANGRTTFSHSFNDNNFNSQKGYSSLLFSFDTYVKAFRGGVGLLGYYNQSSLNKMSSAYIGGLYAPKIGLSDYYHISPAVRFGYIYNKSEMTIAHDSSDIDTMSGSLGDYDLCVGLMVNNERFYAGASASHLLNPEVNILDTLSSVLSRKFIAQFGYHYSWNDNRWSLWHLNFLFQYQEDFSYVFLNDYLVSKKFRYRMGGAEYFYRLLFGLGYKYDFIPENEHVAYFGFGVQDHAVTLGGGFEFTRESYYPRTFEVSLRYVINND
jgi:type IX secretion system PorP/SprF family membrane protein